MKRRRVVQLTALGGLTLPLAGCTEEAADADGNETDNETDTDTEASADGDGDDEDGEDDEDTDGPEDQEFSGSGNDAIEDVSIDGGLTVIDATYERDDEEGGDDESGDGENANEDDSEDEFEVRLIPEERLAEDDQDGEDGSSIDDEQNATDDGAENATDDEAETGTDDDGENADDESEDEPETVVFVKSEFVDSSGEYEGQTAHPVVEGTYVLSVVADGDWEVTISQPRDESGEEPPISVDGSENEVHGPFEFDGSYQPSGEYSGERIIADIYPITDDPIFVFHDASIENPSEFEFEGVGYLSVKSDDEWTIEIE
ncbi:hypothetical protein [Halopiger xanaduensis]|uniref:Uncharacterized protein n=1 Tax=Halopiger xanaduensis (strain DSM 18323 / JCM 14033 / SH-6) TaxID=797210 RepID=F8DAG5_HALXS|nr:hypothetical protein [Halopiger xanaduensis]AEH38181.1 hypothetical protein Halxa_3570 [Halopiger xanaduensis SH-6]